MDETTTTEQPVTETGATNTVAQPEGDNAAAAETTSDGVQETPQETTNEPSEDEQLGEWAKNKGLELDSENTRKAAKMAREAERAMHEKAKRASELEKTAVDMVQNEAEAAGLGDDERVLVHQLAVKQTVRDFFADNPEAKALEKEMISLLQQKKHLAGDLDALYAVALKNSGREKTLKSEGGREALESLATKQTAATPRGSAVNPVGAGNVKITPQNVDQLVGQNNMAWYMAHRDEVNRAMAGK